MQKSTFLCVPRHHAMFFIRLVETPLENIFFMHILEYLHENLSAIGWKHSYNLGPKGVILLSP